ncbi:ferredoxin [Novosphingobium sp. BL-8H]|uniref:ferredoxin n=1 Tax=Novosphingobium sp. BL-8H TaxID=3127640 RepID=UPI0037567584
MKVRIDEEICAGFRVCLGILPELFEIHDDGYAVVLSEQVPSEFEDLVRRAVSQCPSNAISISEDVG